MLAVSRVFLMEMMRKCMEKYEDGVVQELTQNDWANPGKQSNPVYKRIVVENGTNATLNETYIDFGVDTNSNGLYDYLIVGVGSM